MDGIAGGMGEMAIGILRIQGDGLLAIGYRVILGVFPVVIGERTNRVGARVVLVDLDGFGAVRDGAGVVFRT